jgi:hypothetical protein
VDHEDLRIDGRETERRVHRVRVARAEQPPPQRREVGVLHQRLDHRSRDALAARVGSHVDIAQPRERGAIGRRARDSELTTVWIVRTRDHAVRERALDDVTPDVG